MLLKKGGKIFILNCVPKMAGPEVTEVPRGGVVGAVDDDDDQGHA